MLCSNGKPSPILLQKARRTRKKQAAVSAGNFTLSWISITLLYYCSCRPKHPVKVHVWAGISVRGPTSITIFEGIMDAEMYIEILRQNLLPFIHSTYPTTHRFMQDNDPKHTSKKAQEFFRENAIKLVEDSTRITTDESHRELMA